MLPRHLLWDTCLKHGDGGENGDHRASTAFLERTKKESLYNIEKGQNKHGDQIVRIVQVRSIPCPSDKEHGPGNLGWEACVWKATSRGCCQQHFEMKTSICQENMFLLWLIWSQIYWQLVAWTLGLQLQAAHSEWYHFLCSPLMRCCESCLSEVQMCCSFLDGDLVLQMFCFVPWPYLCVFWFFFNHGSSYIRIGSQFFWFPVVFPPFTLCWGGFPSPSVSFRDPHSSCLLAGQPAMWFEVRFVVSGALPGAKS